MDFQNIVTDLKKDIISSVGSMFVEQTAALKKDIITSVGSMFMDQKEEMRSIETGLNKRIDGLDRKIDQKVDGLDQKIDQKVDGLAGELATLDEKVTWGFKEVKNEIREMKKDIKYVRAIKIVVNNHEKRIRDLEKSSH